MKFGKQLAAQQVPVWASFYLDYKGLKKIINSLAKGRPADAALLAAGYRPPFRQQTDVDMPPAAEESAAELHAAATVITRTSSGLLLESEGESDLLQAHRAAFFFKLERELEKINAFYLQKEAELKGRMRTLIDKRKNIQMHLGGTLSRSSAAFNALYDGLRYFERDLSKLQNYIEMNATGFRKILKKWDKRSKSSTKELYLARQVDVQPCFNRDVVSELSDTAAANVKKLENLCIPRGAEQTVDPAADGILSERKDDLAIADAEAQGDLLSNLESELTSAVRSGDVQSANAILANLPAFDSVDKEVRSQLTRTVWQAAFTSTNPVAVPFDTRYLNFSFVDDIDGRTPLMGAAARGLLGLVELCTRSGADVNHRDIYGRQALHYAAMAGGAVCSFVAKQTKDMNVVDHDGQSALVCAIVHGKVDCVDILLKQAELGAAIASTSMLPLSLACKQGNVDIVRLLLEQGHTIASDASGSLPQHIAAREGHEAVLDALIAAGADINAADKYANWTPLFHAANEGHMHCVSSLLKHGADIKMTDDQGKLAVHHAAWSGHPEIVTLLLQASPDIHPARFKSPLSARHGPSTVDSGNFDMDPDSIPDLSLPPPALPLRTYGHSYLDNKRNLLQLVFGHPATSKANVPPVRFYRQDQMTSLRLVVSSPQDSFGAPHTLNLPITDDKDSISLFINDIDSFTLNIEVYPMFGSRIIGKSVCFAGQFANINSIGQLTFPLLDTHLTVVGSVNFEATYTRNFHDVQLAIGGRLETYWKSVTVTNSPPPSKNNGWKPAQSEAAGGAAAITASSLQGDYVKVVVQTTRDGVPFVYPRWTLPSELYDLMISNITSRQLSALATAHGCSLDRLSVGAHDTASRWHAALAETIAPLSDALSDIPSDMGVNIEIRYPTPSDCARLDVRDPPEVNTFVDAVLAVVYANTLTRDGRLRRILFSSFSPAACAALNWKQPNYAVLFASYCGLSRSTPEGQLNPPHRTELDKRCTSIEGAVKFAKANNLLGVLLEAAIVSQVPSLIDSIKEHGLLLALFGSGARSLMDVDAVSLSEGVLTARGTS